jgi:hypothetical protein
MERKMKYYDNLRRKLKAHETKAALIYLRKQWLDKQTAANHHNEYNRIQALLDNSVLKGVSKAYLENRSMELKRLGATGVI